MWNTDPVLLPKLWLPTCMWSVLSQKQRTAAKVSYEDDEHVFPLLPSSIRHLQVPRYVVCLDVFTAYKIGFRQERWWTKSVMLRKPQQWAYRRILHPCVCPLLRLLYYEFSQSWVAQVSSRCSPNSKLLPLLKKVAKVIALRICFIKRCSGAPDKYLWYRSQQWHIWMSSSKELSSTFPDSQTCVPSDINDVY